MKDYIPYELEMAFFQVAQMLEYQAGVKKRRIDALIAEAKKRFSSKESVDAITVWFQQAAASLVERAAVDSIHDHLMLLGFHTEGIEEYDNMIIQLLESGYNANQVAHILHTSLQQAQDQMRMARRGQPVEVDPRALKREMGKIKKELVPITKVLQFLKKNPLNKLVKKVKKKGEEKDLRKKLIRLAKANPDLRQDLLPLLTKKAAPEEKTLTVVCRGDMIESLEEMLKSIKWCCDIGASRSAMFPMDGDSIDLDLSKEMKGKGLRTEFGFDGDGADHIVSIKVGEKGDE